MAGWLIIITGLIYFYVACDLWLIGKSWLGFVYLTYACSNIGLYKLAVQ